LRDLDGDDDLDAFVTNSENGSKVYFNDGLGLFNDSGQTLGLRSQKAVLVDLDRDGDLDAITTHMTDGNPIWLNDGLGTFNAAGQNIDGTDVLAICAGDVDGDDDFDVLLGKLDGAGGNKLYINATEVPVESGSWGRFKVRLNRD
jgi:hypothetical protein